MISFSLSIVKPQRQNLNDSIKFIRLGKFPSKSLKSLNETRRIWSAILLATGENVKNVKRSLSWGKKKGGKRRKKGRKERERREDRSSLRCRYSNRFEGESSKEQRRPAARRTGCTRRDVFIADFERLRRFSSWLVFVVVAGSRLRACILNEGRAPVE